MEHVDARLRQNEPMIIDSFVSNKCNLKCKHCYFGDVRPISEPVSLARWRSFLYEAIEIGIKHFHFSGKESFLDNRIFELLEVLSKNKEDKKIFYGIVSNGMSMNIQGYDEVLGTNISYLEISLEGSRKYNDLIRGENGYDRVYELIENVGNRNKINITSTLFDDNGADLLSMLLAFWELGINKFNFAPVMYYSPLEMKSQKSLSCESLLDFVSLCFDFINNDSSPDCVDIRICMTKEMAYELFLNENILTEKINDYVYRGNKMEYRKENKIIEFSYPLLSVPFLNELVITHDGYIISCADDIHYKYIDKIALPNVNIMKNSLAEVLQARNKFIVDYLEKELS
ncbi:MAG: radical SAM protein [Bacteroides sp.]|nr:radical SAM protein [Bacteroides sp.]